MIYSLTIQGFDILLLNLAPILCSVVVTLSLLEDINLLAFTALFRCVATEAALTAAGFCRDKFATVGEDRENLAFRHIPPPLLYPPRFMLANPWSGRSASSVT